MDYIVGEVFNTITLNGFVRVTVPAQGHGDGPNCPWQAIEDLLVRVPRVRRPW
jgi:hypothetical protein